VTSSGRAASEGGSVPVSWLPESDTCMSEGEGAGAMRPSIGPVKLLPGPLTSRCMREGRDNRPAGKRVRRWFEPASQTCAGLLSTHFPALGSSQLPCAIMQPTGHCITIQSDNIVDNFPMLLN
jgi:hypothetical protein